MVKLPEVLPINKYMPLLVTTRPTFFNGRWYSPLVGRLKLVRLRKLALSEGITKEEFPVKDPEPVLMKSLTRPPKGHKRDLRKVEKYAGSPTSPLYILLVHFIVFFLNGGDWVCCVLCCWRILYIYIYI